MHMHAEAHRSRSLGVKVEAHIKTSQNKLWPLPLLIIVGGGLVQVLFKRIRLEGGALGSCR